MKTAVYLYESAFMMWRRRLEGIYAVARKENWHIEAVDVGELAGSVTALLDYWKPDGLIVEGGVLLRSACPVAAFAGHPVVYCDADVARIGAHAFVVQQDSDELVKKALKELLSRDFGDYAYVHYRTRRDWSQEREAIFRREMSRRGKRARVFCSWDGAPDEDGPAFGRRLEAFVAGLPRPCGVLAANDEMAVHVLRAAARVGLDVPDELTVRGIDDDTRVCENTIPTLSSVAPAFARAGKLAAGLLARRLRHPETPPVQLTFGSLPIVRRLSTRPLERADRLALRAVEYVRVNACSGITVADVVREMGLRTRTAENRFKAVAGRPIRDEILSVRIARAKQLLAESDKSIETVFEQCGYRDARSLRYVFMKATGLSPLAYRKQIRRERKASGAKAQPPA